LNQAVFNFISLELCYYQSFRKVPDYFLASLVEETHGSSGQYVSFSFVQHQVDVGSGYTACFLFFLGWQLPATDQLAKQPWQACG